MIEKLKHFFGISLTLGVARHPSWRQVRNSFIQENPCCAACGSKERLAVHHKIPFMYAPELELSENNLIVLCEGKTINCHFIFGHCFTNWKCYNLNVEEDIRVIKTIRKNAQPKKESLSGPSF